MRIKGALQAVLIVLIFFVGVPLTAVALGGSGSACA